MFVTRRPRRRLSVLVVDDSPVVGPRLCAWLAEEPCVGRVVQAASALQAWTLFRQIAPDVVLLDIHLPRGGALEVLSRVRHASLSCVVMVLTSSREPILRQESLRRGADHVLHKAADFEKVPALLRHHAGRDKLEEAAGPVKGNRFPANHPPVPAV